MACGAACRCNGGKKHHTDYYFFLPNLMIQVMMLVASTLVATTSTSAMPTEPLLLLPCVLQFPEYQEQPDANGHVGTAVQSACRRV